MSFLSRIPWPVSKKKNIENHELRDISEILREGRSSRRLKNLKFTERTEENLPLLCLVENN